MVGIQYAKGEKQRQPLYVNLLKTTRKVIGYARTAEGILEELASADIQVLALLNEIKHYAALSEQVYDQTYRRVIQGETVPAQQKVVSIFEDHTDIIIKDRRDTYYGHNPTSWLKKIFRATSIGCAAARVNLGTTDFFMAPGDGTLVRGSPC
ncbi:MAG: hypothetical protein Q8P24_19755 [Desulfobacterales bacterium]|nr:hypothetical protein [Desulfobacterales bacterium]